jgi:succinyl-CoA synthetase beta subunit
VQKVRDTPSENYVLVRGLATTIKALAKIFPSLPDANQVHGSAPQRASEAARLFTEEQGRARLLECGLPLVKGRSFEAPDSVDLKGFAFPVVVKIIAKGVSHKASLGGVRLGCSSEEAAKHAAIEIMAAVKGAGVEQSDIDGIRVEEMVFGPELLIGLQRDQGLGSHLTIGLGGTLTEVAKATRTVSLPVTRPQIIEELLRLRLGSVFGNQRDALVDLVLSVSTLFLDGGLADLQTVELNPVIVSRTGPQIADVLIAD